MIITSIYTYFAIIFRNKIPNKEEYYSHKMDMTTKKNFGEDHMEALECCPCRT